MDRWSMLAGLRFWLALIVAVGHLLAYGDTGLLSMIPRFGAFEAILGFLLVSGYSIAESYRARPEGYFKRRAARVYPVYLAAMAVTFVANPQELSPGFISMLAANALFLNQALTHTSYVGPAWSLSLEVWLYLLAPWLARCSVGLLQRMLLLSAVTFVAHICGCSLFHWPYYSGLGWGLNLATLGFAWLAGWLVAVHPHRAHALAWVAGLYATHQVLVAAIQVAYRFKNDAMWAVPNDLVDHALRASTLLLVWWVMRTAASRAEVPQASTSRWLRLLGDISYPLYLLHIPTFMMMKAAGVQSAALMLAGAMVLAVLAHHLLESRYWLHWAKRHITV